MSRKNVVLGSGMMLWGLCIILSGAKSYAEDNMEEEILLTEQVEWEENLSVSEETEEILIENLAPMEDTLDGVSDFDGAEQSPDGYTDIDGAEQNTDEAQKSDGELIQEAIDSEAEVTITLSQNISLTETIRVPSGKTVALVPAEGMEITIFRADGFSGPMFGVEKDGVLILGREGGRLLIHQGEEDEAEKPISEGEGMVTTEGEVLVFPESAVVLTVEDSTEDDLAAEDLITDNLIADNSALNSLTMDGTELNNLTSDEMAENDLTMESLPEEELIEDGTMPISMDLNDAVIEWVDPAERVYNGSAHTPEILVWAGFCLLMKGFDYDVTYYNNVHAGTAEVMVTATGFGSCTGSKETTFAIRQAIPEYQVENQKAESGVLLSDLMIPESAAGVNGEKVTGTLYWSDCEGGMALPADMTLSGMEGEALTLYWTFYPGEAYSDYQPVSGNTTITFQAAQIPDNGMAGDWEGLSDGIGLLSDGTSSYGTMTETEKPEEPIDTEKARTSGTETEAPVSETPGTETEAPISAASGTGNGTTVRSGSTSTGSRIRTGGSSASTGGSGTSVSRSGGSSGISASSGISGKTSSPKTGDESKIEVWLGFCFLSAVSCGAVRKIQRRKEGGSVWF